MTAGCSALTPFKARTARCAVLESSGVSQGFDGDDGGDPSNVERASARRAVTTGSVRREWREWGDDDSSGDEKAATLEKGQEVTIEGECDGMLINVQIIDANFVD